MTPALFGLTLANYVEFPNSAAISVTHHAVRLVVLLVLVACALGFSHPGAAKPAPATAIHVVA